MSFDHHDWHKRHRNPEKVRSEQKNVNVPEHFPEFRRVKDPGMSQGVKETIFRILMNGCKKSHVALKL